jgi:iron complex outermembrane receptor protein
VFYANATYKIPVGAGEVVATVGTRYSSAYSVTVFGDTGSYWLKLWTPSQTKSQASVTYNAPNKAWYLSAYIKNIENNVSLVSGSASSVTMSDPRTFGVRAGMRSKGSAMQPQILPRVCGCPTPMTMHTRSRPGLREGNTA